MTAEEARKKTDAIIANRAANESVTAIADIKNVIDESIRREKYSCEVTVPWRTTPYVVIHFEPLGYEVKRLRTKPDAPATDILSISW